MQTQNIVKSYVAASTIAEFDLVKFDANGKIAQCGVADSTSSLILGIAQRGCAAGEVTDVLIYGVSRAKLGAIAAFSFVNSSKKSTDLVERYSFLSSSEDNPLIKFCL